jgi:hypothetical protein
MPTYEQIAKLTLQRDGLLDALQQCLPHVRDKDAQLQALLAVERCNERVYPIESLEEFVAVGKACGVERIGDLEPQLSESLRQANSEDDDNLTRGLHPTIAQALYPFIGRMHG